MLVYEASSAKRTMFLALYRSRKTRKPSQALVSYPAILRLSFNGSAVKP